MKRTLTALLLLAPLVLAGCSPHAVFDAPGTAASGTASPAPSPTPTARDGDDLAACFDGECEVRLLGPARIDLDPDLGLDGFDVTEAGADGVRIEVSSPGASVGMSVLPDCWAVLGATYMASSCSGPPSAPGLRVHVVSASDASGVVLQVERG